MSSWWVDYLNGILTGVFLSFVITTTVDFFKVRRKLRKTEKQIEKIQKQLEEE